MALLIGIEGKQLQAADEARLRHPQTAGVILFTRNFEDLAQLCALTAAIRAIRADLLIAVDHEGGRVQRFRHEFTHLPEAAAFGRYFDHAPQGACEWVQAAGAIMGYELRRADIDFSFAPVLDFARCAVRCHRQPRLSCRACGDSAIVLRFAPRFAADGYGGSRQTLSRSWARARRFASDAALR